MVEFALVLPLLLILLVGIADFGRVFNAGIVTESGTRNVAELVAERYQRNPPPSAPPLTYYAILHDDAGRQLCSEERTLPGIVYDQTTQTCTGPLWALVCVHDSLDPDCGIPPTGYGAPPADCASLQTPPSNIIGAEDSSLVWVEVRVCYQFQPLYKTLLLPFLGYGVGDIYLQRTRAFTVANY
jgi:TadE-like protein